MRVIKYWKMLLNKLQNLHQQIFLNFDWTTPWSKCSKLAVISGGLSVITWNGLCVILLGCFKTLIKDCTWKKISPSLFSQLLPNFSQLTAYITPEMQTKFLPRLWLGWFSTICFRMKILICFLAPCSSHL